MTMTSGNIHTGTPVPEMVRNHLRMSPLFVCLFGLVPWS